MNTDLRTLVLNEMVKEAFKEGLPQYPCYGTPIFGVQGLANALALGAESADSLAVDIDNFATMIGEFDIYPHVMDESELELLNIVYQQAIDTVFSYLGVALVAYRYKRSFELK